MNFDFIAPNKIVFGWGRIDDLPALARQWSKRIFIIDGSRSLRQSNIWGKILGSLRDGELQVIHLESATREPTIDDVDQMTQQLLEHAVREDDLVIAIGGGSALDLAKAVAAMATNSHGSSVRDFLEGVGSGKTITQQPLRMIAVPTTAGTGSEMTKNAVISVDDPPCKKSLRSEMMVPDLVLVDPELSVNVPTSITAASGMDAITQLIESYISKRTQPIPRALCLDGLKYAIRDLPVACRDGHNQQARTGMAYAAMLSGLALANSGLGMAHGVAAALGAISNMPHGLACAVMLPVAMKTNADVAGGLSDVSEVMTGSCEIQAGIDCIVSLLDEVGISPRLRDHGVLQADLPQIAASSGGNSMKGNPRTLSTEELLSILEQTW